MKWNNEIKNADDSYCRLEARKMYKMGVSHRKLSLQKQENIRMALKTKKYPLSKIKDDLNSRCGYCFMFDRNFTCLDCPIEKKNKTRCYRLKEWGDMYESKTYKEFAEHHKKWCKKIGLWKKDWK